MFRRWLIGAAGACVLSSVLFAKQGEVTSKEGQVYRGDVTETDDGKAILIKSGSIETRLHKLNVAKVEYTKGFDEQFADKAAKLQPNDSKSRIELGKWANDNAKYDQARKMYEEALQIDPTSKEASNLLDVLLRQGELDRKSAHPDPKLPPRTVATAPTSQASPVIEKKVLTAADINVIRQKEIRPGDTFNVRLDRDVQRKYMAASAMDATKFNALSTSERALKILEANNPELTRDVKITSDPPAMKEFRMIQPTILSGCASSGCHGGAAAGNLTLYSPAENEEKAYTNFYILQTYVRNNQAMIDRTAPAHSLVLEMGLPADQSGAASNRARL